MMYEENDTKHVLPVRTLIDVFVSLVHHVNHKYFSLVHNLNHNIFFERLKCFEKGFNFSLIDYVFM